MPTPREQLIPVGTAVVFGEDDTPAIVSGLVPASMEEYDLWTGPACKLRRWIDLRPVEDADDYIRFASHADVRRA